jgi:D-sedoheptulose 7-phosphate isomerase
MKADTRVEAGVAKAALRELADLAGEVAGSPLAAEVEAIANLAIEALQAGRCLFFCGNGGSAADAQHLAAEYVIRFLRKRPALAAIALTTDTSVLTAGGNDFGYETVFSRQVEALCRKGDVLFLHSTSGQSENLVRAAEAARARGVHTVAMLARGGGRLREKTDHALVIPTNSISHAQEIHLAIGHVICDLVDRAFAQES